MDDSWTQSLYFLPSMSSSLRHPRASLNCFYLLPVFHRTTLLSHLGKWNWNLSSHLSPLKCVYAAANSTVVMQALIVNENWCALKWMSPMMAFCRKFSICPNVFFFHQMGYFCYKEISVFQGQIGFSLICPICHFLATKPVLSPTDIVKRSKLNPLPLLLHSPGSGVIATVWEAAAALCLKWFG